MSDALPARSAPVPHDGNDANKLPSSDWKQARIYELEAENARLRAIVEQTANLVKSQKQLIAEAGDSS